MEERLEERMKKNIILLNKYVPKDELQVIMSKGTDEEIGEMLVEQSKLPDMQSKLIHFKTIV